MCFKFAWHTGWGDRSVSILHHLTIKLIVRHQGSGCLSVILAGWYVTNWCLKMLYIPLPAIADTRIEFTMLSIIQWWNLPHYSDHDIKTCSFIFMNIGDLFFLCVSLHCTVSSKLFDALRFWSFRNLARLLVEDRLKMHHKNKQPHSITATHRKSLC